MPNEPYHVNNPNMTPIVERGDLLSVKELAAALDCHPVTVYHLTYRKVLRRVGTRCSYRYSLAESLTRLRRYNTNKVNKRGLY